MTEGNEVSEGPTDSAAEPLEIAQPAQQEPSVRPVRAWHTIVTAILRDVTGEQILVEHPGAVETGTGPVGSDHAALPRIRIEDYQWVAESEAVVEAFAARLGFRPWILRQMRFIEVEPVDDEPPGGASAEAAAAIADDTDTADTGAGATSGRHVLLTVVFDSPPDDWTPPAGSRWQVLDGAPPLADPEEEALLSTLRSERSAAQPSDRRPWALDGGDWRERATAWADEALAARGRRRTGPIEQQRTWGISCVLRVPTDTGRAYLKAAARLPLFLLEGPFVAWLAEAAPEHSPDIIGVHEEEGWLLTADFGDTMRPGDDPVAVDAMLHDSLRTYGRLQRRLASRCTEMRAFGAFARGLDWLAAEIEPLLADPLVAQGVAPDVLAQLRAFAPRLRELCAEMESLGLPDALLHGDLHPGNMALSEDRILFFDWTDAAIGHPFLDPYVATSHRRPERTAAIREGYLEAWAGAADEATLARAWELARPLTMLYQASSYRHLLAGLEPMARPGLDGGLSGWLEMLVGELEEAGQG